jgi:hypothetical protein
VGRGFAPVVRPMCRARVPREAAWKSLFAVRAWWYPFLSTRGRDAAVRCGKGKIMSGTGSLRLRFFDVYGDRVNDSVNIFLAHAVLSHRWKRLRFRATRTLTMALSSLSASRRQSGNGSQLSRASLPG